MSDCIVTCSHIPKQDKQKIKQKVQSMGGVYTDTLVQKNTHLVTDTVLSEKYVVSNFAAICGVWAVFNTQINTKQCLTTIIATSKIN